MDTPKPIHIFRAGRHTDMSGRTLEFTPEDLRRSAAAYDPAKWAAPIVVGHPAHDAPAYGEIAALAAAGDDLEARPVNVDPAFAELVKARRYKSVSASFYLPDAPANPVPGVYYLRHVGFLGAMPPALKGLRPAEFAGGPEDSVEFADFRPTLIAQLFGSLRDFLVEKFGRDEADKTLPQSALEAVRDWAENEADDESPEDSPAEILGDLPPSYSETPMSDAERTRLAELEAENARLRAEADAALRARQTEAAQSEARAFCESLIDPAQGAKLTPAQRALAEPLLARLAADAEPLAFGEGETQPALAALKALLNSLPVQVHYGELARQGAGATVPTDPTEIAAQAAAYMEAEQKAGRKIDLPQAIQRVMAPASDG